jgi:predicted transglutaminase-like cysteine proteinase
MVFIAALAASTGDALPRQRVAGPELLAHVLVSGVTQPPPGWVGFCARGNRASALARRPAPQNVALSRKRGGTWFECFSQVNETIKPLTDLEHWGVVERCGHIG